MTTSQPIDLDAIQARANAATPGPWGSHRDLNAVYTVQARPRTTRDGMENDGAIATLAAGRTDAESYANARFIAAAREDVDALVAEVRRLRAVLDAEKSAHLFTLRQRNNRSTRLMHLRDIALTGDTEALLAAAKDTLAASVDDHKACHEPTAEGLAAATNPTPLRWGFNDVLWGDDDTVTVLLSGPEGEPYWLELDPERATVLRQDLAGPPPSECPGFEDNPVAPDLCAGCGDARRWHAPAAG